MVKLKRDLADFNAHFDSWFSETTLYDNGAIENTLARMKENGYTYEKMVLHGYARLILKMIKTVF